MMFNNNNVTISSKASIGKNVRIGDYTIIFDNVVIEDNVIIAHNCIIGEPLNEYYFNPGYKNPSTVIGANSLIRSHTIIYAGNKLEPYIATGHRVTLRENNFIGNHTVIGTLSDIQGNVIIGNYCKLYTNVHIAAMSRIGNFVSIYPFVVTTNDPYPPSDDLKGVTIKDYTQVGAHSTFLSNTIVGENCLIGVDSVITRNFPDFSLIMGNPAIIKMDIRNYVVLGKGRLYPWMYRFSRGMPWENIGYDAWINKQF